MLARKPAASVLSLSPSHLSFPLSIHGLRSRSRSLSLRFIPRFIQIGLYNIVAAGWMSVEGRREIGGQSYCHSNWDKDLAYALPPPPVSVTCLRVSLSPHNPLVPPLTVSFS